MALDAENDIVFWRGTLPSQEVFGIHRLDLTDGSNVILVEGLERFNASIALDPVSEQLYWSNAGGIWRSDLDGNGVQLIVPDAGNVASIVVAPVPEPSTLTLALAAFVLAFGRCGRGRIRSGRTTR